MDTLERSPGGRGSFILIFMSTNIHEEDILFFGLFVCVFVCLFDLGHNIAVLPLTASKLHMRSEVMGSEVMVSTLTLGM